MEKAQKIEMTKKNIKTALADYFRHANSDYDRDDISNRFIENLAKDAVEAKEDLRNMLRKSPAWNEELDCLVINGNRTHEPDGNVIHDTFSVLFADQFDDFVGEDYLALKRVRSYFSNCHRQEWLDEYKQEGIDAITHFAPNAYKEGKKPSRILKSLCEAMGIVDNTAGSDFQKLYAKIADEMSAKKIDFKLFVSINPAHFLSMSNPKYDRRGSTLTSCHSFNCTDYEYNNGCTGYARDEVTMIAFTVADPSDPETLNNRKTTRQLFMYQPNNGVLLQSRMYNTSGGTTGAQSESKVYRELIQREIAECEDVPNLWSTADYIGNKWEIRITSGDGFGGYPDWIYSNFNPKISIRQDKEIEGDFDTFEVGTTGLCISCGGETWTNDGLYCSDCDHDGEEWCEECEEYHDEDDMYTVYDSNGNSIRVCESCRDEHYYYCEECGEYHHEYNVTWIESEDIYVCDDCRDRYFEYCEDCGDYHRNDEMNDAHDWRGNDIRVCDYCLENHYAECGDCGEYYPTDDMTQVYDKNGDEVLVCDNCLDNYEVCEECGEYHHVDTMKDGLCVDCYENAHEDDDNKDNEEVA